MGHIRWKQAFLSHSEQAIDWLLTDDFKRISLNESYRLNNPKYLFISLCNNNGNIKFGVFKNDNNYRWTLKGKHIMHKDRYLNITNDGLTLSDNKDEWIICEKSKIKNINCSLYLTCDLEYNIVLTNNADDAISFHFENNGIHYIKPAIQVEFEMNNVIKNINVNRIYDMCNIKNDLGNNVGLLLAAGTGSRFGYHKPKQLYRINDKPIVRHCIDALANVVDHLIIVTNSKCIDEINELTNGLQKAAVVINDYNCRLKSIENGLSYIKDNCTNINRIVVHDSARPFITANHIQRLLNDEHPYSQYSLKLVNGLYSNDEREIVDRDRYTEICTPVVANFNLYQFIFDNYIADKNRITYEHISILNLLKIKYSLVQGNYMSLRKITFMDDVNDVYC